MPLYCICYKNVADSDVDSVRVGKSILVNFFDMLISRTLLPLVEIGKIWLQESDFVWLKNI